ncbi:MAG: phosphotransferase [Spirochaetales bacterium]|jgi:aminoglycoside 2''-phosphotransferase|nr:phosphotransferase [Spirochaetales bacterium]
MYRHLSASEKAFEYKHLEQIKSIFPELDIESKDFHTDGFANDVITINNKTVFRFPKYQWALDDMFHEESCIQTVRLHTSMRLPEWSVHHDKFISYQRIPGSAMHPWKIVKENQETIAQAAADLGQFLKDLHHIPVKELRAADIHESITNHSYVDWLKFYDDIQQELYPAMTSTTQNWADTLFRSIISDNSLMDFQPKFIAGELSSSHILFDYEKKVVSGIVDFRSAGTGDPAFDLAYFYSQYGERFVEMMQYVYQGSARLLKRARFIAETFPLQWALGGIRTGNPYWYLLQLGTKCGFSSVYEKFSQ